MSIIDLAELRFVKLSTAYDGHVSQFDCSQSDLNEFIRTHALQEQYDRLSVTRLACYHNLLVGYFSLANSSIVNKNLDDRDYSNIRRYPSYPALMIARLAVHKDYQRQGIGIKMLERGMGIAYKLSDHVGCRFITVDVKVDLRAIKFYTRFGFKPRKKDYNKVEEILHGDYRRNEDSVFMYFDLWKPYLGWCC